jgi:hypothetical protein
MCLALDMEESALREGFEIVQAGIANVCKHRHPEGGYFAVPRVDFGA